MTTNRPFRQRALRRAGILLWIVVSVFYALTILKTTVPTEQKNDAESAQTVEEARAILRGCHNNGLLEYTHHPIGRAYLLAPFVDRFHRLEWVPITLASSSAAAALLACLLLPTTRSIKLFSLAMFGALLFQPGFNKWLGNLHQHSYNLSSIFALIAVCVSFRNVIWIVATIGFVCGWIGYDFIFAQIFTIITARFLYWRARHATPLWPALREAIGESCIFLLVFSADVALKLFQNTLYFKSATSAFQDFYESAQHRSDISGVRFLMEGSTSRARAFYELLKLYPRTFWTDPTWSSPPHIIKTATLGIVVMIFTAFHYKRRGDMLALLSKGATLSVAWLLSVSTILVWFAVAPTHAAAHGPLFVRMLLVPLLLLGVSLVLACSKPASPPSPPSSHRWMLRTALAVFSLAIIALLPRTNIAATIDAHFFPSVWAPTTAGFRQDAFAGPHVSGTPSASSTHPGSSTIEPVTLKNERTIVGDIGMWGQTLEGLDKSWRPDPSIPLPSWYQLTFDQSRPLADVALRMYGPARECGAHTPERFIVQLFRENGEIATTLSYPGESFTAIEQGKFLTFHRHLAPPVLAKALRLTVDKTQRGGLPVLFDLHAFSAPLLHGSDILGGDVLPLNHTLKK